MEFYVGQRVRIQRDYWEHLARPTGRGIQLYIDNGPDYVYEILSISGNSACISDAGDRWSLGKNSKLEPAYDDDDEISPDLDAYETVI